jgi:hypothetical protein
MVSLVCVIPSVMATRIASMPKAPKTASVHSFAPPIADPPLQPTLRAFAAISDLNLEASQEYPACPQDSDSSSIKAGSSRSVPSGTNLNPTVLLLRHGTPTVLAA